MKLRPLIMGAFQYFVGDGSSFYLWSEPWHPMGLIRHYIPRALLWSTIDVHAHLDTVIFDGDWDWPVVDRPEF